MTLLKVLSFRFFPEFERKFISLCIEIINNEEHQQIFLYSNRTEDELIKLFKPLP